MKLLQTHSRLSFAILYLMTGAWFAAFDLTLKQGWPAALKGLGLTLAGWPLLPLYDIFLSRSLELMVEGLAELAAVSAVFYAWYRLSRPAAVAVKTQE